MKLDLAFNSAGLVAVTCNAANTISHTFSLQALSPNEKDPKAPPQPLEDPVSYGKAVFTALFPPGSDAAAALDGEQERVLIVAHDSVLDSIPWEFTHDADGFLATRLDFVRGLPNPQPVTHRNAPLHVVGVFSNPIDEHIAPLNIEPEWQRLKDVFDGLTNAAVLDRVRPPTLARLGLRLSPGHPAVIHFTGHGTEVKGEAGLCFESEPGALQVISAREFAQEVKGQAFLTVLSACVSATPGPTPFSNLARLLAELGMPYALGMRFSVLDVDALVFTRHLYEGLAAGKPIEKAVTRARREMSRDNPRAWAVGVPVLYTSLNQPAQGFQKQAGQPEVRNNQPYLAISALPPVLGAFQGRVQEQIQLGKLLTGDVRPRYITLLGVGGQGKTALAWQTAQRVAWAWPGGVYALSLEQLPSTMDLLVQLSNLLGLALPTPPEEDTIARQIHSRLEARRTLLIFDNCETLIEAVESKHSESTRLAAFLQNGLPASTGILFTSRRAFGFGQAEQILALEGLSPLAGGRLFLEAAGQRADSVTPEQAQGLSIRLGGHPLSLRLLGLAFAELTQEFEPFAKDVDKHLKGAEDKYKTLDDRQRSLFASLDASTAYLSQELLNTLTDLRIFQAAFPPEFAAQILDPGHEDSPIPARLAALAKRGLLTRLEVPTAEGKLLLYSLLPPIRLYAREALPPATPEATLLERMLPVYTYLLNEIYNVINQGGPLLHLVPLSEADLDQAFALSQGAERGRYANRWGTLLYRLGNPFKGRKILEDGLAAVQGNDKELESAILDNIGQVCLAVGLPQDALRFLNQSLALVESSPNRASLAATLNNIGSVYADTGQPQLALLHFNQALPIEEEVDDRAGLAATLHQIGSVYLDTGQPQLALQHFQQALPIFEEVGDRAGTANTLFQVAHIHLQSEHPDLALPLLEQVISLDQAAGMPHAEAGDLFFLSSLLASRFNRAQEAIPLLQRSIQLFHVHRFDQDDIGRSLTQHQQLLDHLMSGEAPPPSPMPAIQMLANASSLDEIRQALEDHPILLQDRRVEGIFEDNIQDQKEQDPQLARGLAFLLGILRDAKANGIPAAIAHLEATIQAVQPQPDDLPLPEDFVPRCLQGLRGAVQDKMALLDWLKDLALSASAPDNQLIDRVQKLVFGTQPEGLLEGLEEPQRTLLQEIIDGLKK